MSRFDSFKFIYRPGVSSTNDLRAECRRLLKIAKGILEDGKQLMPVGFIVKPDGTLDLYSRNTEPGSLAKQLSHAMLSQQAKRCNAIAVILVQDTWMRRLDKASEEEAQEYLRNYRQGDLEKDPKRSECLNLHAIGPAINYAINCFYHRAGGGKVIVWDEEWDSADKPSLGMTQGLIEPWWDTSQETRVS